MKSEPNLFSITHLATDRTSYWSGVRNYQARNFMRDQMQVGELFFFYHSRIEPIGIAGIGEIVRTGYPDDTAWDPNDEHYDPKSSPDHPIWYRVDIRFVRKCPEIISLKRLKSIPALKGMQVVQKGMRLSIQPVTPAEWNHVMNLPEWRK